MRKTDQEIWHGVKLIFYATARSSTANVHPWVADLETKTIRGEACLHAALQLRRQGFSPDVIIAHPGWGESLFVKDVWPHAKLGIYCEFYYHPNGTDVGFDPEFPASEQTDACRLRLKNLNNLLHFEVADAGIAPTQWQASSFPERFRNKITVMHDGIDTNFLVPNPQVCVTISTQSGVQVNLTRQDEVITFVNRNLEPYRGYHNFMRALPHILRERPKARVLIVGGNGVSYGARPDPALYGSSSWREIYAAEVRHLIKDADWNRVHFLGHVPYGDFVALLQLSAVHVYLTYPFVLSWSLLEAMSVGCAIVASRTSPVLEVIHHAQTGRLVDFFDVPAIADEICKLLAQPTERSQLGQQARAFACANYDLNTVCLPQQIRWVQSICASI
jgi:glycosyltransferase involved in cell wall biosynthesis